MKDLVWILAIVLLIIAYWLFGPLTKKHGEYKLDIQHLPKVLQKGYQIQKPYNEDESESDSDSEGESELEPEPFMKEMATGLGAGKVVEVQHTGQVYDAQGESYYRKNGCDVFLN